MLKLLERLSEVIFVVGVLALVAIRVTPPSWFPWDWVICLSLLFFAIALFWSVKLAKRVGQKAPPSGSAGAV